jgi:hypothetical protein
MSYELVWEDDTAFIKLIGEIYSSDLLRAINSIAGDYRFDDLRKRICDCTAVTDISLAIKDLIKLAYMLKHKYV